MTLPEPPPTVTNQPPAVNTPVRRRRRWRRWAYEGIFALAIFVVIQAWMARGAAVGSAPELYGVDLQSQPIALTRPPGQATVVHFWATWCGICGAMDDNVAAIAEHYPLVSVALNSGGATEIKAHLQQRDLVFPVLLDDDGAHSRRWGVRGVPTTFFITADGQVHNVTIGYSTRLGLLARTWYAGWAS